MEIGKIHLLSGEHCRGLKADKLQSDLSTLGPLDASNKCEFWFTIYT